LDTYSEKPHISMPLFLEMLKAGFVIDARAGGLVLGPTQAEGGILLLVQGKESFEIIGKIEGGSFIVNATANRKNTDRLEAMEESGKVGSLSFENYVVSTTSIIYNAFATEQKFLWITGEEFIVNPAAASAYIKELEELNFIDNPYTAFI
jgi:hypothetical protein